MTFAANIFSVDTIPLVGEQPFADAVRAFSNGRRGLALCAGGSPAKRRYRCAVREAGAFRGLLVVSLKYGCCACSR